MSISYTLALMVFSLLSAVQVSQTAPGPTTQPTKSLTIVTANIRYNNPGDGPNAWPKRRAVAVKNLHTLNPDLLGLQEVLHGQLEDLKTDLPEYSSVGVGRDDGKTRGEYSPIFFRASRFKLVTSGTFWLSPTPDKVASKGWDAALPRICTWAVLLDKDANRQVLFANAHFDHRGTQARIESAKLLASHLPTLAPAGTPILVSGDFNSTEDTGALKPLMADPISLTDIYRHLHSNRSEDEATYHGFEGDTKGSRIDFILSSPQFRPVAATIDRTSAPPSATPSATQPKPLYSSDHFFVTATVKYSAP